MRALFALVASLLWFGHGFVSAAEEDANTLPEKPNVLFIFADDQCFDTIAALGNDEVQTPNLDRLVKRGTTFTRCYNQGGWNGAICVASRTMLISGRYLWHAERNWRTTRQDAEAGRLWPQLLKQQGYGTYFSGKWHINAKPENIFDVARHTRPGMPNQTPEGYNRPAADGSDPWSPYDPKFGGFWKGGTHWSEVLKNDAVDYLERAAGRDEPFFMYLAFNAPHDPRQSPKEFVDRYPLDDIAIPKNFQPLYPQREAMGAGKSLRDEKLAPFPRTEHSVKVHRQEYYAIITHMDHQIGEMLEALDRTGKADNTLIVFTADHGLSCGQHGLLGKQNMYEHSLRVPFIMVGPGVPQGKTIDEPIYLQDVVPTTLKLAGMKTIPEHVEFQSLLPLVTGSRDASDHPVYGAYMMTQRMVLADGFKLVLYPRSKTAKLFDVNNDPHEMQNLADNESQSERMRNLFATLLELQQETGDPLDLTETYPELSPKMATP